MNKQTSPQCSAQKVLVVSPTPPPYSGPEVMTLHLLESPLKDIYNLIHFNISKQRDISTKSRFDWINVLYGLFQPIQLFGLLIKHRPNLVYTNLAQNLGGFLRYATFIIVTSLFGIPVVVRVMGDGFNHFYANATPVLKWIIHLTLKRIDCYIVRAEVLKKQFEGVVPPERLAVVYSGIKTEEFNRTKERISDDDRLRVLFVGYLTKAKGALDLLRAIPKVTAECPNIEFQLMGARIDIERNITYVANPNSNEAVLDNLLAEPTIAPYINLLGVQSGQQKLNSFVQADMFVLPSYSEAFPTVVLEAMAAGLPVIATPVGALPEVFDENHNLFFEPGDITQMAENILRLAHNPDLRIGMGQYNRKTVEQKFSLDAYANRLDKLFHELLLSKK